MTASGFRLTRVPPLLGRTLLDEDERPGAPPVVVIGHELWQRQFNGDAGILGQNRASRRYRRTRSSVSCRRGSRFRFFTGLGAAASHRARRGSGCRSIPPCLRPDRRRVSLSRGTGGARRHRASGWRRRFRKLTARSGRRSCDTRRRSSRSRRPRWSSRSAGCSLAPPPAPHRRGECRDPRLRAHGDTLWRDHRANRARSHPRPRHHAAVRRSARAVGACRRPRPHAAVTSRSRMLRDYLKTRPIGPIRCPTGSSPRLSPAVIVYVAVLAGPRCRRHRRASGAEGDRQARAGRASAVLVARAPGCSLAARGPR